MAQLGFDWFWRSITKAIGGVMDFLDDPDEMTPDERLHELAAILAAACMHLLPPHETPLFSPLPDKGLDVSLGSTPPLENGNGLTHREPLGRMP